jgi:hypothetical protein
MPGHPENRGVDIATLDRENKVLRERLADETRRAEQISVNFHWLLHRMDGAHMGLCRGMRGTWQQRAEQVEQAAQTPALRDKWDMSCESFKRAYDNDPVVRRAVNMRVPAEEIIGLLAKEKEVLVEESIARMMRETHPMYVVCGPPGVRVPLVHAGVWNANDDPDGEPGCGALLENKPDMTPEIHKLLAGGMKKVRLTATAFLTSGNE